MGVVVGVGVDMDMGVDVVGVGVVVGLWGKGNGGRKLGGGGERRSEEEFNVQRSKFNKVELWHVMLKPIALRERVAREGGDARGRGHEREETREGG